MIGGREQVMSCPGQLSAKQTQADCGGTSGYTCGLLCLASACRVVNYLTSKCLMQKLMAEFFVLREIFRLLGYSDAEVF